MGYSTDVVVEESCIGEDGIVCEGFDPCAWGQRWSWAVEGLSKEKIVEKGTRERTGFIKCYVAILSDAS